MDRDMNATVGQLPPPGAFGQGGFSNGNLWWTIAASLLTALLVCTLVAVWGYQRHAMPPAADSASAASEERAAGSSARPERADSEVEMIDETPTIADAAPAPQSGLSWPIWEFRLRQPIPPRDPSLTPPVWRLIGASMSGGKWAVILQRQGSTEPEYFVVGQELPGGFRIVAINDEDVTLVKGKKSMVLSYLGSR